MLHLSKSFPPGLKYAVAFDTTTVIGESIRDVLITLLQAILLVVFVIFIFLQDWRSTLIPADYHSRLARRHFYFREAPWLLHQYSHSVRHHSRYRSGRDDAIVVIENVERHIAEGITEPHNAASVAMKEVAGAVIATSLVLVARFVPVALFPGTTGILFRQFALTIAFSVAISAFNALTLDPGAFRNFARSSSRTRARRGSFRAFNRDRRSRHQVLQPNGAQRHRLAFRCRLVFFAFWVLLTGSIRKFLADLFPKTIRATSL